MSWVGVMVVWIVGLEMGCILTGLLGVVVGKFSLGCGWGFLNGSLKFNLFRLKEPFDAIANGLVFSGCLVGICGSLKMGWGGEGSSPIVY